MSTDSASNLCGSISPDRREYCEALAEQCVAQREKRAITYNLELEGGDSVSLPNFDICISYAKFRAKSSAPKPPIAREEPAKPEPDPKPDPIKPAGKKPSARPGKAAGKTSEPQFDDKKAAADAAAKCEGMFDPDSAAMKSCVEYFYPCFSRDEAPFTLPFSSSTFPTRDMCLQFATFHTKRVLRSELTKKSAPSESPSADRTKPRGPHKSEPLKKADANAPIASFARMNFSIENSEEIRVEKMTAPFIHDKRQHGAQFTLGYFVEDLGGGKYRIHYQAVPGKKDEFTRDELEKIADFTVDGDRILEDLAFQFELYYEGNFKRISSIEIVQI